jgi:hypothetical protein
MRGLGGAMDDSIASRAGGRGGGSMVTSAQAGEGDTPEDTSRGAATSTGDRTGTSEEGGLSPEEAKAFVAGADILRTAVMSGDREAYDAVTEVLRERYGAEGAAYALQVADAIAAENGAVYFRPPSTRGLSDDELADLYQHASEAAGPVSAMRVLMDLPEDRIDAVLGVVDARVDSDDWSALERKPKEGERGRGFWGSIGHFVGSSWHHFSQKRTGNVFARVADNALDIGLDVVGTLNVIPSGIRALWDGTGLDSVFGEETAALEEITQARRGGPESSTPRADRRHDAAASPEPGRHAYG